jgi:dynein heavy chain
MNVMKHISEVKEVKSKIDMVVERMKSMVVKLKKHSVPIMEKGEEDPIQSIEAGFAAFNETDKKVNEIKKDILTLIVEESIQIKKKLDDFTKQVDNFKADFKANLPYSYDDTITLAEIQNKYKIIDDYYAKLQNFEHQAKQNAELENLFELDMRQYKPLKECMTDLKNLKTMWDIISLVNIQYNDWKNKPWRQIDAGTLQEQNKAFLNQIRGLNKEIRFFKGYNPINEKVNNMQTTLTLVESLRNDCMEERHWKDLKTKTKSDFDQKSPNFTFEDILKIKLFKYKADTEEIVDIATK